MLRILIFEDDRKFRTSLELYWEGSEDIFVAATFDHAQQALKHVKTYQPDVVIMDIEMPGVDGITALTEIKKNLPDTKILILTAFQEDDKIFAAVCGGANGYVLKGDDVEFIEQALQDVSRGGAYMNPNIALRVMKMFQKQFVQVQPSFINLTDREKEVLHAMVQGNSRTKIASKLNIVPETVGDHIKHIYKKLHVNSAPEAVREAILRKII